MNAREAGGNPGSRIPLRSMRATSGASMPKIDISKITPRLGSSYPPAFKAATEGREKYGLGDAVGLDQFGVNLTRLKPGAASSHRHWHENEDEFIFVIEGEIVLIEDTGETLLGPG